VRTSAGEAATELVPATEEGTGRPLQDAAGIARGAAVIAGLTIVARILGLLRTLVFSQAVGATCLGTAYVTANQVPNLIYELVLGGAISSVMVPVLARSAERAGVDPAEKAKVSQISSALLTWTVVILVPLTIIIAASAGPVATLLNPANPNSHCVHADLVATTADMLRVFSPQAFLYGLSVVLFGMLQAYRRFAGYALAPAVSSLVLIGSYLAFAKLDKGLPLSRLPLSAELVLSLGTTVGIAALVLVAMVPAWRLHLRLRPGLRFPPGVARRVGGLALVGVVELVASDVSSVATIALANGRGPTGALVIFNYASQVFNTLNAVLALSITLSAFPVLASRDGAAFDRTSAGSTRAVLLAAWLATALIVAVSVPAAHVLAKQPGQVSQLVLAFVMFAPGLVGIGLVANLARVMLALGRLKVAALAVGGSWVLVIIAEVALAELLPGRYVAGSLALGTAIGQIAAAIPMVIITRRIRGKAAVQGALARVRHLAGPWTQRRRPPSGPSAEGQSAEVSAAASIQMAGPADARGESDQQAGALRAGEQTTDGAADYRSQAMAILAELGYAAEIPQPDPGYAVVQIKKGRRAAVVLRHGTRPLTYAMTTGVLATARLAGIPTLLIANQPLTLAATELTADANGFAAVYWAGESHNEELIRALKGLAAARHRR
jgi:putative peptidoglycan lipid II flippase